MHLRCLKEKKKIIYILNKDKVNLLELSTSTKMLLEKRNLLFKYLTSISFTQVEENIVSLIIREYYLFDSFNPYG